ncbi:MAG: hypothetical protein LAT52_08125, partial [Balneolales bacterium]|nr:hypothetical protein [Balneolales bacterium]
PADRFAEFEPESTILAMEAAVRGCGHEPVRLGGPYALLGGKPDVDLIWNIAEGYGTRNREGWVPVLCELYGIPFLGSDALTLSWSLDKALTKQLARSLGIPTSDWQVIGYNTASIHPATSKSFAPPSDRQIAHVNSTSIHPATIKPLVPTSDIPLFIKPRYEGTAKGITESSIVRDAAQMNTEVERLQSLYNQDLLIEQFLPGAEYTVAVTGSPLRAHPVLERGVDAATGIGFHVMDVLGRAGDYRLENRLTTQLEDNLKGWSLQLCAAMGVRHFARLDFKCDAEGNPFFLEINPLPTFAVDNTFAILAELEGVAYEDFLARVLSEALLGGS